MINPIREPGIRAYLKSIARKVASVVASNGTGKLSVWVPVVVIFALALARLLPHIPNFAPITAMALFGGVYLTARYACILPLVAMLISDYLLLYVSPFSTPMFNFSHIVPLQALFHSALPIVYASFIISGLVGLWLKNHKSPIYIVLAALFCSIQFFLLTNAAVWLGGMYGPGPSGLLASYVAGIPFFQGTLLGDFFYTTLLFGAYELALKWHSRRVTPTEQQGFIAQ